MPATELGHIISAVFRFSAPFPGPFYIKKTPKKLIFTDLFIDLLWTIYFLLIIIAKLISRVLR